MITGAHTILFSTDPEATRAFLRDTLGFASVDAGGGWLIFALPPGEVAAHPTDGPPSHELYLLCDDLDATLADLAAKGVEVSSEVTDERWGRVGRFAVPGLGELAVYEPRHPLAIDLA
jgi:catechol 2,3-dioxygenase-like lactoylglutathione lyase family enzyme